MEPNDSSPIVSESLTETSKDTEPNLSGSCRSVARNRPIKYSKIDVDKKIVLINCYKDGKTINESAEIAGINKNTAKCIIKNFDQNGGILIEYQRGGSKKKITPELLDEIEYILEENPSVTPKAIRDKIVERKSISLSQSSVYSAIKMLQITLKCAPMQAECRNSPKTIDLRKEYALQFSSAAPSDSKKIIFIDESVFINQLIRRKSRSKVNNPAYVAPPTVRGRNVSLILAINSEGILCHEMCEYTAVNSEIFFIFLQNLLAKLSEQNFENTWLVLDNTSVHNTQEVREIIQISGHRMIFLPPNSSMLNPIKDAFCEIKFNARNLLTDDATNNLNLVDVIDESVSVISSASCNNYYKNMYTKLAAAAVREPL